MQKRRFFDATTMVGQRGIKHRLDVWRTEELISEMERIGVAGALIYHGIAREYDPMYGNMLLLEELKKSPRLSGCWIGLPHHMGDFPRPAEFVAKMRENSIVGTKLFPKTHGYSINQRTVGELLQTLQDEKIPLLIENSELSYEDIAWVLDRFPRLNLILQGVYWGQEREILPLMEAFLNLYLEFSSFQANAIIEEFAERFGAERLLFGSDFPSKNIGAAKAFIDYARLSEGDKDSIAGGNLSRLTGTFPPEPAEILSNDKILMAAMDGKPLTDILVIDGHAHLLHDGARGAAKYPMAQSDIYGMMEINKSMGIDVTCISSWLGIFTDSVGGNRITKAAMERYPDAVVGYVTINPLYISDIKQQAVFWHGTMGFKGCKPYYPRNNVPYNDPLYDPWWEYANEHRLFALLHLYSGAGNHVKDIAARYSEISFLLAHSGASMATAEERVKLAKEFDNIFLEITYTAVPHGSIEYMVRELGAERVVFGTDAPMRDPRPQFGWLAYSDISESDKRLIFGENMKRILDRCRL